MASMATLWSLAYYPVVPSLCVDSSLKVISCSNVTAGVPAFKSTFQEGGKRREGWPWPFKVTSQKGPDSTSTYHWPELSHMAPSGHKGVLEMSFSWFIAVSNKLGICYERGGSEWML